MNSKILKHRTHSSIPETYQSLNLRPERQHCCLVEDVHHQFMLYDRPEANNVVARAIHKIWPTFEHFLEEKKQTILAYHDELFKSNPPRGQDEVQTALYVWFGLCDRAADRTTRTPVTQAGRNSSILASKYSRGPKWSENYSAAELRTPQLLQCYRFLRDSLRAQEERDLGGMPPEVVKQYPGPTVTEEEMRQVVAKRAGELHTKQDPWRIFQYYRPQLMKLGIIRRN